MKRWKGVLVFDVTAEAMSKQGWRCPIYEILMLSVSIFFNFYIHFHYEQLQPTLSKSIYHLLQFISQKLIRPVFQNPISHHATCWLCVSNGFSSFFEWDLPTKPYMIWPLLPSIAYFFTFNPLAFLWNLKHGRITPVLGPLHKLSSLPGVFFPWSLNSWLLLVHLSTKMSAFRKVLS